MDPQSLLPVQRAAHYLEQADKLQEMAESELGDRRDQLLALAQEYQDLARRHSPIAPIALGSPHSAETPGPYPGARKANTRPRARGGRKVLRDILPARI